MKAVIVIDMPDGVSLDEWYAVKVVVDRLKATEEELMQGIRLACMIEKTEQIKENDFVFVGNILAENRTVVVEEVKQEEYKVPTRDYGIALDIGTTTLAMRLVELLSGESAATITAINHQRAYGADVITRIGAANDGKLNEMQKCILQDIENMLTDILSQTGIRKSL